MAVLARVGFCFGVALLCLTPGAAAEYCGPKVKSLLLDIQECLPYEMMNVTLVCGINATTGPTTESAKRCDWSVYMNYINYIGAVYNACQDKTTAATLSGNGDVKEAEPCITASAPYVQCLADSSVDKAVANPSTSECACAVAAYDEFINSASSSLEECSNAIVTPLLPLSTSAEYYVPDNATALCADSITCVLPPIEPVDSSEAYQVIVNSTVKLDEDMYQAAFAIAARLSTYQVVIFRQFLENDLFAFWFKLVGLDVGTVDFHVSNLNATLQDDSSYLRRTMQVQPQLVVVDNPYGVEFILEKEEEVPAFMIVLLVIFGIIILVGAGAAVVMYLNTDDDSDDGDEEGEMGDKDNFEDGAGTEHAEAPKPLPEN
ncbi:hypothetical protein DIPPA_20215 [Diplonema papillatum]|nr:hypothetical protein DIPPA_02793 [Diplonema papillatum]KAJ9445123.1 hypothetical protein DIPPA_20215 [Diplonema papillatum]